MRPRTVAALVAFAALGAAEAAAQTSGAVRVSPNRPGTAARLIIEAAGGTSSQVIPEGISFLAARGFRLDRRAVAQLCEADQRQSCPTASRVGLGTAEVRVSGPVPGALGAGVYRGAVAAFLAPAQQAGDLAGLILRATIAGQSITAVGRITRLVAGTYGIRIAFDPLPQPPPLPPGYKVTLKRLRAEMSAHRTVQRTRTFTVRRRNRLVRRRITDTVRYDLIRNPPKCRGRWPVRVLFRYPDRENVLDTPIACTP